MRILDRYLSRQVLPIILLTGLMLVALDLFLSTVDELKMLGIHDYSAREVCIYLCLTIPRRFYVMFPFAALIGTLLALGHLASNSELIAMRAASISPYRITWGVLKSAFWLTLLATLIGEGLAPPMERYAKQRRTLCLSHGQALSTAFGTWIRANGEFIHIKQIVSKTELEGITRFKLDEHQKLQRISYAQRAYKKSETWRLEYSKTTRLDDTIQATTEYDIPLDTQLEPELIENADSKHLKYLSLRSLWRTIEQRRQGALDVSELQVAFWSKALQPLVTLIMVVLSVPFVFGKLRHANNGLRTLVGILLAYAFHVINGVAAPLAHVYHWPGLFCALIAPSVFFLIALFLLRRSNQIR